MLARLTKSVIEAALDAEMEEHLGYHYRDHSHVKSTFNERNGSRKKILSTELGPVEIQVPRDRDGTFAPFIVPKRRRRLTNTHQMVLPLVARGLTLDEVAAYLSEACGQIVSKQTTEHIERKMFEDLTDWRTRPLASSYSVVFVDAIHRSSASGASALNKMFYVAIGLTEDGGQDALGVWADKADANKDDLEQRTRFWRRALTRIADRGVNDVLIVLHSGLKGLATAVVHVWPHAAVQASGVHLFPNQAKRRKPRAITAAA